MTSEAFEAQHPLLLLNVWRTYREGIDPYETSRWAWRVNAEHAVDRIVVMHAHGIVVGVFTASEWVPVTIENGFPVDSPERLGFIGEEADARVQSLYMGRAVPECLRGRRPERYCPRP